MKPVQLKWRTYTGTVESGDLDTDLRYFDGDLSSTEDLLELDSLEMEVFGLQPKKVVTPDEVVDDEGLVTVLKEREVSPYVNEEVYFVLDLVDCVFSIAKTDKGLYDFSQVFSAEKVEMEGGDMVTVEFEQVPTSHLADLKPSMYEQIEWTVLRTLRQDNGTPATRLADGGLPPEFSITTEQPLRCYLIRDPPLAGGQAWASQLDFTQVYVVDGATRTLMKSEVEGLENLDRQHCTLIIRPDGLKVVDLTEYDTVDSVVDAADQVEIDRRMDGEIKDSELPDAFLNEEFEMPDEPDVPQVDLI